MKFIPHDYQRYCITRIIQDANLALFLDMGLGKTVITLTAVCDLIFNRFQVGRCLVIAPKKVAEDVKKGQAITQAQAEDYLASDLAKFEGNVSKYDRVYHWSQNEFDALVSFAYNVGSIDQLVGKGVRSRLVIAEKILHYNKADGKISEALKRRREAERKLFLKDAAQDVRDILEYSLAADGGKKISRNFKVKEFRCKDGSDKILADVDFVTDKLQVIRDHFGAAVTINSAYRTEAYNKKVGGASKSYHMAGQAFDIVVKGHTPLEVAQYAQTVGINGIIQYNGFVHVDSRNKRYWARDDGRKVTVKSGF